MLIGILKTWNLANVLKSISAQFTRLNVEVLVEQFDAICASSKESQQAAAAADAPAGAVPAAQGTLAQYGQDLTARAREGKIDPVVGRDEEIRQMVDILMRRRQNNPLLTGGSRRRENRSGGRAGAAYRRRRRAGAAAKRSAVAAGYRHASGRSGHERGNLRRASEALINEVQSSATPIILFIDEIHTLIGAGGQQGTGDAANLLKPALGARATAHHRRDHTGRNTKNTLRKILR